MTEPPPTISWQHVLEATGTVLLTSLEDCIWLVPFLVPRSSPVEGEDDEAAPTDDVNNNNNPEACTQEQSRSYLPSPQVLCHASLFVISFGMLGTITCILAWALGRSLSKENTIVLQLLGAFFCWILAFYLLAKDYNRRQQRERRQQQRNERPRGPVQTESNALLAQERQENRPWFPFWKSSSGHDLPTSIRLSSPDIALATDYSVDNRTDTAMTEDEEQNVNDQDSRTTNRSSIKNYGSARVWIQTESTLTMDEALDHSRREAAIDGGESSEPDTPQGVWIVIVSLTIAGSLDEMSYFPGIIVGNVFTAAELTLATWLAAIIIVMLVHILVKQCQVCLYILDQIPLYAVIGFFAVIMTLQVIWDLAYHED